jgi:hypothetical protein
MTRTFATVRTRSKGTRVPTRRALPRAARSHGSRRAEIRHILHASRLQQAPKCSNQSQVDSIRSKNPRSYPNSVTMELHEIVRGDSPWSLATKTRKDNKVVGIKDLSDELTALNTGVRTGKIGNCVVLIKGWESPAWRKRQKRVECDERIKQFKADKDLAGYKTWEEEKVGAKDHTYHDLVDRVKARTTGLYQGRREEYVKFVQLLNKPWIGALNVGECVAMPKGWVDPNIGTLPSKPAAGAVTGDEAHAIATVYGEQTGTSSNAQEQQKYIWLSIRKRIQTAVRGPNLKSVVVASEYHAIGKKHYNAAIADLKKPTPTKAGVVNAKKAVLDNWTTSLPSDAGAFYFHWRKGSTPETCFGASRAKTVDGKEKECAWKWAKKQNFEGSVTKSQGWLKRIRGDTAAPKERIGSMYIYP